MPAPRRWWLRFRSSVTGRFVTRRRAAKHPRTTIAEHIDREPRDQ